MAIQWAPDAPLGSKVALRACFTTGLPRFARNDRVRLEMFSIDVLETSRVDVAIQWPSHAPLGF